jgi:hypothetical protein
MVVRFRVPLISRLVFFRERVDLLLILIASLYSLSWFHPERIYVAGDLFLPLSKPSFANVFSTWFNKVDFGYPAINLPLQIVWQGFFHLLISLGVNVIETEKVYFVMTFFFSGLGMSYLVKAFYGKEHQLAALLSALLYMYNPYIMISFGFLPMYAVFPWFLAFLINAFEKKEIVYAVAAGLSSLVIFLNFPNPLHPFLAGGTVLFLWIFLVLYERNRLVLIRVGKITLVFIIISMAINLWWIIPTINTLPYIYQEGATGGFGYEEFGKGVTVLPDVLRLMGSWGFQAEFDNKPYIPYGKSFYANPTVLIATFILPLMVFTAAYCLKRDKFVIYFLLLSIFFLFFAKGSSSPMGDLYAWALRNVPLFATFRDPYKFIAVVTLSYSVLYGLSIVEIFNRIMSSRKIGQVKVRKVVSVLFVGSILTSLLISAWPMVTGDILVNWNDPPNRGVKIPGYYYEADSLVSKDVGFRTLFLPRKNLYSSYSWGFQGADIMPHIFSTPVVSGLGLIYPELFSFPSGDVIDALYNSIYRQYLDSTMQSNDTDSLAELLGIYSIKYVMFDGSVISHYYTSLPANVSLNAISNRQGIVQEATFGQLRIFKNQMAKPIIYGASKPVILSAPSGNTSIFNNEVVTYNLKNNFDSMAIFLEDQNDLSSIEALRTTLTNCSNPTISFERVNPTEYVVHVNASTPFILVFTEGFDQQWKAYVAGEESSLHMVVNVCSNAWVLNKTGQYDVRIEYVQQDLLVVGTVLSISAFASCLAIIAVKTRGESLKRWCKKAKEKLTRTGAQTHGKT